MSYFSHSDSAIPKITSNQDIRAHLIFVDQAITKEKEIKHDIKSIE